MLSPERFQKAAQFLYPARWKFFIAAICLFSAAWGMGQLSHDSTPDSLYAMAFVSGLVGIEFLTITVFCLLFRHLRSHDVTMNQQSRLFYRTKEWIETLIFTFLFFFPLILVVMIFSI